MFKRRQSGSANAELQRLVHEFEQRVEVATKERLDEMRVASEALGPGWQQLLERNAAFVLEASAVRHAIRDAAANYAATDKQPALAFQISSLFLRDCHRHLTSDPEEHERLILVSGSVSADGVRILSRMICVEAEQASAAYVSADPRDCHSKIIQLVERDGHPLLAMWHNHVSRGAESTRPSAIDIANQTRFCAMGWDEVIGGITSSDGYFRLFSTAHDFEVSLYGSRASIVADRAREKIIKLELGDR